jgi:hypothetical protein
LEPASFSAGEGKLNHPQKAGLQANSKYRFLQNKNSKKSPRKNQGAARYAMSLQANC